MAWDASKEYWVGTHKTHGLVVVPRAALEEKHLRVFLVSADKYGYYFRDFMRANTEAHVAAEDVERAIERLKEHEARQAVRLEEIRRERELAAAAAAEKAAQEIRSRHRVILEKLGKDYSGVRVAVTAGRKRRVTHCYSCHQELDNNIDLECCACGWILCECGACGCGYAP